MRIHQYPTYEAYCKAQIRGSRRRSARRPSANPTEIYAIGEYLVDMELAAKRGGCVQRGICHGARCGTEIKLFQNAFPTADVIGTDLAPMATGDIDKELFDKIIYCDFHDQRPEWVGQFDFVYSNSLDHSPRPSDALKTWMEQLKPTGLLFLTWTFLHTLESRPVPHPGGDCFGAALHEYIKLVQDAGRVHDLLWIDAGLGQVVIVGGPKN